MLAVKGKCTLCKNFLTIMEPGIVCFQCEKYHHGTCLIPPHDMKMLTKCVLSKNGWLCPHCSGDVKTKISWKTRTDQDIIEVKDKIDIIVEVKELLTLIEAALRSMSAKCKELNDEAVGYRDQNKVMKEKIKLHEKRRKPKNYQEWQKGRKELGIDQRARRKPVRKTKDAKEAALRRKELEKHLKKEHQIKPGKKEKPQKIKTKKKGGKIVYYTNKMLSKGWIVQILLFLIMIAYTFIGALIFTIIEGRYEEELVNEILTERQRVLKNLTSENLSTYYDFLVEKYGSNSKLLARGEQELNWSFVGSLFFCGTTYTTIGYGDITPVTDAGKIFTIIYAMIGIPLFLILLASLGRTILKMLEWDCFQICKCRKTEPDEEYYEMDESENVKAPNVSLWYMMLYIFILILIGAVVFFVGEGWYIEDSIYFIFITLYTIGFGDLYPTNRSYMLICVVYIIIGLVFASMTIALVGETMKAKVSKASSKLGKKIDQYSEEKKK